MSVQDIQKQLKEQGIDTIEAGFSDFQGALRGKRFPLRQLPELLHNGFATCRAALAWDIQCGIFPIPLASFENGYPDLVARPILETLRPVPWRPGSAFVLSDIFDTEGNPLPESPREVLKKTLAHAKTLGYRPLVGAELEFYLLNENNQPVFSEIQAYSLSLGASLEYVIRDIRNHLEAFGIEVEASNTEYGPAQIEINLTYGDALQVADQTILFKNAVKEIAHQHGLRATFMAKPWEDQSGSGLHLHQSLWDLERSRNLFAENPEIASQYLAGLLVTLPELSVFGAPSINAYKRVSENSFAPTNASWGGDNRTVAVRSLLNQSSGSRLELRSGAADANPYLAIAASIAGGLYGITHKLKPPVRSEGNAYLASEPALAGTLKEALDRLEKGHYAREAFGDKLVDHFLALGRHEQALYEKVVTDWERNRYLITP